MAATALCSDGQCLNTARRFRGERYSPPNVSGQAAIVRRSAVTGRETAPDVTQAYPTVFDVRHLTPFYPLLSTLFPDLWPVDPETLMADCFILLSLVAM